MKTLFIMLSFFTLYSCAMKTLPNDRIELAMQYSLPKLNLYYQKKYKYERVYHTEKGTFPDNSADKDKKDTNNTVNNLQQIVSTIQTFRLVNSNWNNCIINNITTWLGIDKDNVNALLIRATQANIPYFIKLAVAHKADLDFVHKPDGYTPLLCATKKNEYHTCAFLLKNGASVNIKREAPYASYTYNTCEWPIHVALSNDNNELVKLFIAYRTPLDFSFFLTDSLLTLAAKKNNPYILTTVLEAPSLKTNYYRDWSEDEIEHALETAQKLEVRTDEEKLKKRTCTNMLEEAQKKAEKNYKITFFDCFSMTKL